MASASSSRRSFRSSPKDGVRLRAVAWRQRPGLSRPLPFFAVSFAHGFCYRFAAGLLEAKMRWLAIVGYALGMALAPAVSAQQGPKELPSVEYDGKRPATLHYDELTVTIDGAPGADKDN